MEKSTADIKAPKALTMIEALSEIESLREQSQTTKHLHTATNADAGESSSLIAWEKVHWRKPPSRGNWWRMAAVR